VTGADVPELLVGLCDDAAVFPPGSLPLEQAVPAHVEHARGRWAALVGPFILAAADLDRLAPLAAGLPEGSFDLTVTVPLPGVADAVAVAGRIPAVRLVGLEVVVPEDVGAAEVVPALDREVPAGVTAYVELPRDHRRAGLVAELAGTRFLAKLRTGGVRADLYPDELELAAAVHTAVAAGVPFKATAGLHHAVRNTDPRTGFEQHGFLNLLAATGAAADGASVDRLVEVLADRDPGSVAARVRGLDARVREWFRSFGTCSISEPAEELVDLGLLPAGLVTD